YFPLRLLLLDQGGDPSDLLEGELAVSGSFFRDGVRPVHGSSGSFRIERKEDWRGPLPRTRRTHSWPAGEDVASPNARASLASPSEKPFSYPYLIARRAVLAAVGLVRRRGRR